MLHPMKKIIFALAAAVAIAGSPKNIAHAAAILVKQSDGSISAGVGTGCNNACSDVPVASQVFVPAVSAKLGAIEVFTSNFGTSSRNPETNSCYLRIYNGDTGTLLASSDSGFSGYGCAGDLVFTFRNAQLFLQSGVRYRWEYVFGGQNFSGVTFAGSPNNTVGGLFSAPPVVNAKFTIFSAIAEPVFLTQSGGVSLIASGGTTNASTVILSATLPSATPDSLRFEVELEPSFVAFKGQPNLMSDFVSVPGAVVSVSTSSLVAGGYHWQARAVDQEGNQSAWTAMDASSADSDFVVYDPSSDVVLQDGVTAYGAATIPNPCFGDNGLFSCALSPSFNRYTTGAAFRISKITFTWRNWGQNNCDGMGNYGVIITSSNSTSSIIATSTNRIYMGCPTGDSPRTGEFDFSGETVPANFYLTFGAFDGDLQGGAAIGVANISVFSSRRKEPAVIIPGVFGSTWKGGRWILQPIFKPYDALKATLVANGYEEGKTLFDFPYDWEHESIPVIAREFANKIKAIRAVCGCQKINVIAHSMGGLVARQYVESGLYQNDVDQLIFLGAPQLGSPLAYLAWEGGTTLFTSPIDLVALLEKALIRQEAIEAGFGEISGNPDLQIYRYIHASSSPVYAFQELLPTYNYLRDASSGGLRAYPAGYPRNAFLEDLNAASGLDALRKSGVRVSNFYSEDQPDTLSIIDVKSNKSKSPLWNDGTPAGFERVAGDDTVPKNSAVFIDAANSISIPGVHLDLPANAAGRIVELLDGNSRPATVPPPSSFERYLSIFAFSPVDLVVTAPDGSKVGKDFSSGGEINQIAGAFYSGSDSSNEYVFIPNPLNGPYTVSAEGTATGTYRILASYGYETASLATSSDVMFGGNTRPGLVKNFGIAVDSQASDGYKLKAGGESGDDRDQDEDGRSSDRARLGGHAEFHAHLTPWKTMR